MYHKRVAEYEEASSTLTYSMTPVVEGSPKKKMRMMPSAPPKSVLVKQVEQIRMSTMGMPQQQKVEQFAPSVSSVQQPTMIAPLTPPQSSWKSIAIDELAMKQSNLTALPFKTFSSNTTTLDNSRRVSLAASDVGYDDGSMYCVTAPMKFPETINLRPSDVNVVSSSTTTPVGIVSPISQINMDFDTLDTTFDLNNNDFDKLFDLEDQDSKSSSDDSASCSSITDDDMSMECDAFELPFSPVTNKMEEAQPDEPTSSGEPSVDDFLKLIAQLDDNLSSYPMALAA